MVLYFARETQSKCSCSYVSRASTFENKTKFSLFVRVYRFGPPKPFGIYASDMPLYTVHDFELNSGIYFFETSPEKAIFTIFHYCAFESAALANPHRNVYVIVSEENRNLKRGVIFICCEEVANM